MRVVPRRCCLTQPGIRRDGPDVGTDVLPGPASQHRQNHYHGLAWLPRCEIATQGARNLDNRCRLLLDPPVAGLVSSEGLPTGPNDSRLVVEALIITTPAATGGGCHLQRSRARLVARNCPVGDAFSMQKQKYRPRCAMGALQARRCQQGSFGLGLRD